MDKEESFCNSTREDQINMAERELSAFIRAVTELFGPEQARFSTEGWLDESELMDSPPLTTRASGHGSSFGSISKPGEGSARSSNACDIDRSEAFADTIVQLFRTRASDLMAGRSRRVARLPLRDSGGD